jgi:hypothetical protein
MQKTTLLKTLYTGGAVVLGGLLALHVIPESLSVAVTPVMAYLVLHSFLPSAKTGSPQG